MSNRKTVLSFALQTNNALKSETLLASFNQLNKCTLLAKQLVGKNEQRGKTTRLWSCARSNTTKHTNYDIENGRFYGQCEGKIDGGKQQAIMRRLTVLWLLVFACEIVLRISISTKQWIRGAFELAHEMQCVARCARNNNVLSIYVETFGDRMFEGSSVTAFVRKHLETLIIN